MKLHGENESYQSRTSAENMKSETKCGENEVILVKIIIAMTKFDINLVLVDLTGLVKVYKVNEDRWMQACMYAWINY